MPPVTQTCPPLQVPIVVVTGADIGVLRREMAIEESRRKPGRAVIDIDIGASAVLAGRDLDGDRAAGLPVVQRIRVVEYGVIPATGEFAGWN